MIKPATLAIRRKMHYATQARQLTQENSNFSYIRQQSVQKGLTIYSRLSSAYIINHLTTGVALSEAHLNEVYIISEDCLEVLICEYF
jgi:hypothetical protein